MPSPLLGLACISTALAMGLVAVLFRTLQPFLRERLTLSDSRLERFDQLLVFSWVPLMPLAGWLVDHWGLAEVLFVGSLVLGLAVSWLALCQSPAGLLWGLLGLGVAGACLTVAGVALMPVALHLSPRWSVGAAICLGYVFVGLAAVLTPAAMPWLSSRLGVRRTLLSLSLLCLLPALLIAMVKEEIPRPLLVTETTLYDVRFWLIAFVALLYPPLEQSLEIWPRPYLAEIGYSARTVIRVVIGFWCAFFLLRFGLGWMIRPGNEAWLVLTLLVLSSMVLGNLAGAYGPAGGFLGFWLLGACYGPLLPALLGILESGDTHHLPGRTLGAVFAILAVSSLVAQPLLAAFAKRHAPRECMRIPLILGLVMAAPMLVAAVIRFGR